MEFRKAATQILPLFLLLLIYSSCGMNDSTPENSGVFDITAIEGEGSCKLDTNRLAKILEVDITQDILCLQTNLNRFVEIVRRKNPKYIQLDELKTFIKQFFPTNASVINKTLGFIYNLNGLLLKDPMNKLSVSKISALFKIFQIINIDGAKLYQYLKGLNKDNYWNRQSAIFNSIEIIRANLLNTITQYKDPTQTLNIQLFLNDLKKILELTDEDLNVSKIIPFFFIKKLFIGGDPLEISALEVEDLIKRSTSLIFIAMDLMFSKTRHYSSESEKHEFYFLLAKEARSHLYSWGEKETIITHKELINVLQEVFKNDYDIQAMEESILKIKQKIIRGDKQLYSFKDIKRLADWSIEFTGMLYYNSKTFKYYKKLMSSKKAIRSIKKSNLKYPRIPKKYLNKYWKQFSYIAKKYRFYHNQKDITSFSNHYIRTSHGLNNLSMLRWTASKLINIYGHRYNARSVKEVRPKDLEVLLNDVKSLLKELDLWPNDSVRLGQEAVLSSDLFQYQSNGNNRASVNELTEYINTVISSVKHRDNIHSMLIKKCGLAGADDESIEIKCFRENFTKILFTKLKLERYYRTLAHYYKYSPKEKVDQYFINLELYARINPDPNIPINREDLNRIIVIMSNVESIFIRFDRNKDGFLKYGDLGRAFSVFKMLIKDISGIEETPKGIYKSIFLYLIKKMKIPSKPALVKFHYFENKKKIKGTRFNISAILSNFIVN